MIADKLYPYQEEGVSFLVDNGSPKPKHSLLADDMGLGKTAQLIRACERVGAERVLVLCPASIKINWMREFFKWSSYDNIFIVKSGKSKIPADAQVIIINYDLIIRSRIHKQLLALDFTVGIMDEAHYLQSRTSKRTKAVLAKQGVIWKCEYKWAATGTPMPNRPKNMYPLLRSLAPYVIEPHTDYMDYAFRYCGAYMGAFGIDDNGCSNARELSERLKPFMLRRLKEDVLDQLPDKTIQYIYLEHTPAIKQVLDLEAHLSEDERQAILEYQALGNMAKIRHELALAKLDQCLKFIKDQMETLDKVVIFAYHKEVIRCIAQELDPTYGVALVTGGMSGNQKQMEVDEFVNNPDKRIFLGQIQAAGVGIDGLQHAASTVIFVETDWVPGSIDQAIDRCRRIGQKNNVLVQFLIVPDSLEADIVYAETEKRKNIKTVMGSVEKPVSKTEEYMEETPMTMEQQLDRIANALEDICESINNTSIALMGAEITNQAEKFANACAEVPAPAPQQSTQPTEINPPTVEEDHERERLIVQAKNLGLSGNFKQMKIETLRKRVEDAEKKINQQVAAQANMPQAAPQPVAPQPVAPQPVAPQPVAPAPATDPTSAIQLKSQQLVAKLGPQPAHQFCSGVIAQVGGQVLDASTQTYRPARLADLSIEQKAQVVQMFDAKLAE